MLDKIELNKKYDNGLGAIVRVLAMTKETAIVKYESRNLEEHSFLSNIKESFSEIPKPKVKRAKYLCKYKTESKPFETIHFHIDCKDFLNSIVNSKKDFDYIRRMQETEREFDE